MTRVNNRRLDCAAGAGSPEAGSGARSRAIGSAAGGFVSSTGPAACGRSGGAGEGIGEDAGFG
jgi:hypothetical protein